MAMTDETREEIEMEVARRLYKMFGDISEAAQRENFDRLADELFGLSFAEYFGGVCLGQTAAKTYYDAVNQAIADAAK